MNRSGDFFLQKFSLISVSMATDRCLTKENMFFCYILLYSLFMYPSLLKKVVFLLSFQKSLTGVKHHLTMGDPDSVMLVILSLSGHRKVYRYVAFKVYTKHKKKIKYCINNIKTSLLFITQFFYISYLVAKVLGLNFGKKLSNFLSNGEALS